MRRGAVDEFARARGCQVKNNLVQVRCPSATSRPVNASDLANDVGSRPHKPVGEGWGYSRAAHTHGVSVLMGERMRGVEEIPAGELRDGVDPSLLCRFAAGTTIAQLDKALASRGRALVNAPGFDALTFVGVASVGGNGSGSWLGPLSEQIRSLDILYVDTDGTWKRTRVEPAGSRAITRPGLMDIEFDDALFDACKVGLGLLGVVVSITIDVVPAFYLVERRTRQSFSEMTGQLPSLLEAQGARHSGKPLHSIEVWMNPYRDKNSCLVGTRAWTDLDSRLGERPAALRKGSRGLFRAISVAMRLVPAAVPWILNEGLRQSRSNDVRLPSSESLGFGTTNLAEVEPAAVALDAGNLVAFIENLKTLRRWLQREFDSDPRRYVSSPIGLRFVGGASSPLSPHAGRRSCLVEFPLLVGTPDADSLLRDFLSLMTSVGGRPHWGQIHALDAATLANLYGDDAVTAFKVARSKLDPLGRLDNDFSTLLGLSLGTGPALAPERLAGPAAEVGLLRGRRRRSWGRVFSDLDTKAPVDLPKNVNLIKHLGDLRAQGHRVVLSGGNCSMHTQNFSDGSRLYLDTESVLSSEIGDPVSAPSPQIKVGAAARWRDIVAKTRQFGYLPHIVPTYGDITVGGSLSANSIGQASRHAGHELDHVLSLKVIVPGGEGEAPSSELIDAQNPGQHEELLRAVVGGYGLVGLIEEATYSLTPVPADARAITKARRFEHDAIDEALAALERTEPGDTLHKSCVFFHRKGHWSPTVLSTRIGVIAGRDHPSLLTYSGDGALRRVAEGMLSFMPSAHFAGKIADKSMKKAWEKDKTFVDPVEGFLFVMEPNGAYKDSLSSSGQAIFAPTIQQTFVVPGDRAEAFIRFIQDRLAVGFDEGREGLHGLAAITERDLGDVFDEDALRDAAQIELDIRARSGDGVVDTSVEALTRASLSELTLALLQRLSNLPTLIPALFEMVWVPADRNYLSSTFGQSGFAVSLTFQGPGVDPEARIVKRWKVFRQLHNAIYASLRDIAERCAKVGGRFNLSKNVFTPNPNNPAEFVRAVLQQRPPSLDRFEEACRKFNHGGFFGSRFGSEILGLK
ncbi:MAG TPA: D-arabinono-1,4-lactone oxidase [Myxococcota bacterium]|nr:D-arabinono-1,4-lactone oxidase [Myxococcota bacterium]